MTITRFVLSASLLLAAALLLTASPMAQACPSDFDQFGVGGRAVQPGDLEGEGRDVIVAPNGLIYVAATLDGEPALIRYKANGQIDNDFGFQGRAVLHIPGEFDRLALLANGQILAAGSIHVPLTQGSQKTVTATVLARYFSTGEIDLDFGEDEGFSVVRYDDVSNPLDIMVRSDGKIVVVGKALDLPDTWHATFFYFNADGKISSALGAARAIPRLDSAFANSVVEVADKAIVIAGTVVSGDGGTVFLARYDGNGALDTTFGRNGIRKFASPNVLEEARSLARDSQGRIYLAGNATPLDRPRRARLTVRRFNANGARDKTYGRVGKAQVRPGGPFRTRDLSLADDGEATVPAFRSKAGSIVVRFLPTGRPDRAFGHLGISGIIEETLEGLDVQTDGKIVAAGHLNNQPAVIRYEGGEWDGVEPCVEDCGNGILERLEECDDDNVTNGDGCSAACLVE